MMSKNEDCWKDKYFSISSHIPTSDLIIVSHLLVFNVDHPPIHSLTSHIKMKIFAITLVVALVAASPITIRFPGNELEVRQFGSNTKNELQDGGSACPKAIFIFARASTETGNMVSHLGIFSTPSIPNLSRYAYKSGFRIDLASRVLLPVLPSQVLSSVRMVQMMSGCKEWVVHTPQILRRILYREVHLRLRSMKLSGSLT